MKKAMFGSEDAKLTKFQSDLLKMLVEVVDSKAEYPTAYYTPKADILKVFVKAPKNGHTRYLGPWKKNSGQGHAVESIQENETKEVIGFQIWGITELLEQAKKKAEQPTKVYTEENFKEMPSFHEDGFDGWRNA